MDDPTPRIPVVSLESPPEEVRERFAQFLAQRGNVPNLFRTLAHRPVLVDAYATLLESVLNTGTVETDLKEMAVLRISLMNGAEY